MRSALGAGLVPNLESLCRSGRLMRLRVPAPAHPVMSCATLATGRHALHHRQCGPFSLNPKSGLAEVTDGQHRKTPALWHIAEAVGLSASVIAYPYTTTREPLQGTSVPDAAVRSVGPLAGEGGGWWNDPLWPDSLAKLLTSTRVHPQQVSADTLRSFVAQPDQIDQELDNSLARIADAIAQSATVQAIATPVLANEKPQLAVINFPGLRLAQRVAADERGSPYHAVQETSLRLHDEMLGHLLALADSEVTVLVASPYGPGLGSRSHGFLAACGPGVRPAAGGEPLDAHISDVVPTVLHRLGLPHALDLSGRPLDLERGVRLDKATPDRPTCLSWDHALPSPEKWAVGQTRFPQHRPLPEPMQVYQGNTTRLASSLLGCGQTGPAIECLHELREQMPGDLGVAGLLGLALLHAGHYDALAALIEEAEQRGWNTPLLHLAHGVLHLRERELEPAGDRFDRAAASRSEGPGFENLLGEGFLALRRYAEAADRFGLALSASPDDMTARYGYARARLGLRDYAGAANACEAIVGVAPRMAGAYFHWANALVAQGNIEQARVVLTEGIAAVPDDPELHDRLAQLMGDGDAETAKRHRHEAERLRNDRRQRMAEQSAGALLPDPRPVA
ncbi:MAG: tetratricopeptide repeat protein [Planctomycetota bacterium]